MSAQLQLDLRPPVAPRVVRFVWGSLLCVLAVAGVLHTLASRRPYTSGPSPVFGVPSASLTDAMTSAVSALVVGTGIATIALALPVARWPRRGGGVVLGGVAFGGSIAASAWWNGAAITIGVLALPIVLIAMATFPRPSLAWFEGAVTVLLRGLVWGSLAAAVVVPSWAVKQHGASTIAGIGRLAGLTPHPNSLGPLAVALLAFEWRRSPRRRPAVALAALALVWAQSKTSWAAAVLMLGIMLFGRVRDRSPRGATMPLVVLAAVLGFSAYIGLGVLGDAQIEDRQDTSTETFTGRTAIWEATLEVWSDDPILGHGTALWDDEMDARFAHRVGFPPGHAHNQLIQTLGQAGIVGAVALVAFLVGFARLVRLADGPTRGVAPALLLLIVVRCFSEPPLQSVPQSSSFFLLVVTLGLALVAANEDVGDG